MICWRPGEAQDGPEAFDPAELLRRAAAQFRAADRDGDDKLSLDEFLSSCGGMDLDDARRQFARCDLGDDGKLGRGEFIQWLSPADERGDIADPMVELEQAALAKWQAAFTAAGGNGDRPLTRGEWPEKQIAREIPGLADVTFDQWDRNRDGKVDESEGRWLLGVAYGLTLPDGRPIRTSKGRVFSWAYFRMLDGDRDGKLSRQEFTAGQTAALFDKLDADRDGRLTVEETRVFLWHDTLANFFSLDHESDGYMGTDDFLRFGWGAGVARRTVRAFDGDGDAKISFPEFLNTTFANYASEWARPRRDADDDGRLSWQEFYIEKPPIMIAQSRWFFDHFDLDHDGSLSLDEMEFSIDLGKVPAEVVIRLADTDSDGFVSRDESLATAPESERVDRARQFLVFDFDGDGKLAAEEYRAMIAPTDERGAVRDPIADFEQAALEKWEALFAAADKSGAGALTRREWPARQIARELPVLAEVAFEQWDRDGNGKVDRQEGHWLLEVAYGLTLPDGRPIRTRTGRVFSWYYFRALDKDGDGTISRDEFVSGHYEGKEKSTALFAKLDADGDGRATVEETLALLWHDVVGWFLAFDRDRDGYMSTDEFLALGWGTSLAKRTVAAFDADGDQKISFGEFRGTTFANQASDWMRIRRDADNDGRLSWSEFYLEKSPLLIAQSRWFFDRFDLDDDGFLSYAEWEFDTQLDKVPAEILFAARDIDGDGKLVLTELFPEPKPPDTDASARDRYEMRLAAEENRFLQNDKDGSGYLDLEEFTESQRAFVEAARRQSKVVSDRKTMLEGNYYVRKGVLVVNEIAFLAIVWMVVRRTGRKGLGVRD